MARTASWRRAEYGSEWIQRFQNNQRLGGFERVNGQNWNWEDQGSTVEVAMSKAREGIGKAKAKTGTVGQRSRLILSTCF